MSHGVVIAGAGLAAQRCAETLRRSGYDGRVRILGEEPHRPYDRPPLSKEALLGETTPGALALRPEAWYADNAVELLLGRRVTGLAAAERRVTLDGGEELGYEQLVIATGGRPRPLAGLTGRANVHALRTLGDARRLGGALGRGARLAVVGAGFVGLEVAATARRAGAVVTLIEAAPVPLAGVLGLELGGWFARLHSEEGVDVRQGRTITAVLGDERADGLALDDGSVVECDEVLVAVGMAPATEWLEGSGLDAALGIPTDPQGRTALPEVFAAGDAARPLDPLTGAHRRSEHWEAAARQGAATARAILDLPALPAAPEGFWSDQYGVRFQLAGTAAGHDRLVFDGDPATRDFQVHFLSGDRAIGGLLAGRPHALPGLRRTLAAAGTPFQTKEAA